MNDQPQRIDALLSALERTERNLLLAINQRPVRDLEENLAENRAARKDAQPETEAWRRFQWEEEIQAEPAILPAGPRLRDFLETLELASSAWLEQLRTIRVGPSGRDWLLERFEEKPSSSFFEADLAFFGTPVIVDEKIPPEFIAITDSDGLLLELIWIGEQ